jgi:exopolyphosphatase/guanosine-5'-triphosphate,3'-diphosphate pyrophosphatase
VLCTFLRIAESLDRSHLQALTHARLRASDRRNIVLEITPARDCHLELWEVRTHEKAFEKVFARKLTIRILEREAQSSA